MPASRRLCAKMPRPQPTQSLCLTLELLEDRCLLSASAAGSYGQLPLSFEANLGQADARVNFLSRGSGYSLFLTPEGAVLSLQSSQATPADVLHLRLVGAATSIVPEAQDRLPGVSNYLIGNDPARWHTNIPTYGQVAYQNVYPGVDFLYHGYQGQLEYDFVVNPGAHPGAIRFAVDGSDSLRLDAQGNLIVQTSGGELIEHAPVVYQELNGVRQIVAGRYVLENDNQVGFAVGAYDASRPLTIDPVLSYSTYLGGSGNDQPLAVAVDSSGAAYVTGETGSTDFPTVNPFQGTMPAMNNAAVFVAKLNPAGTALEYSTYLGGSRSEVALAIAVDASGNAYVTGVTQSSDFPTAGSPYQPAPRATSTGFVSKLNPSGNGLVYSTYLGGSVGDTARSIAVDPAGDAYVTGQASSSDFPTVNPIQATKKGNSNAFVTKLNASGSALIYSTFLGGTGSDNGVGLAVDAAGSAYVAGATTSTDFPTAGNPLQAHHGSDAGANDVFVAKIDPFGSALVYSTYLGGSGNDSGTIAIDGAGNAYIGGTTSSSDFPTAGSPVQRTMPGTGGGFVAKLGSSGSSLVYSTYLGGSNGDEITAIAVDGAGNAFVTGRTSSTDFPVVNGLQAQFAGGNEDAFVTQLNGVGGLVYSTYLGGNVNDQGAGIAVDSQGTAYIVGSTNSMNFPTANPLQRHLNGTGQDGFVTKIVSHVWKATDVAVGSDGKARLLWDSVSGQSNEWSVDNNFHVSASPAFGPFSGWTAQATAAGTDGLARILWTNTDGSAALWLERSDGMLVKTGVFGPFTGWSAQDTAVGSDGNTRVLWTNANGQAVVWSLDANLNVTSGPVVGPFTGWTASRLAAGSDGRLRLLWNNTNGAAALWILNADGSFNSAASYGPIAGWTAVDVGVSNDGTARILWTNTNGSAAVWSVNLAFGVSSASIYGPFLGYTPSRVDVGSDGLVRLLWTAVDGTTALWLLDANGNFLLGGTFGPL